MEAVAAADALTTADEPFLTIEESDMELQEQLGAGGMGVVFRAAWKGQAVAVKMLHPHVTSDRQARTELLKEAATMCALRDRNVLRLIGVVQTWWALVLECMDTSLDRFLADDDVVLGLDWTTRWRFALDIARGLDYLHHQKPKILHRDLKSPNVLVRQTRPGSFDLKISDFGFAKAKQGSVVVTGFPATERWSAPELQDGTGREYQANCDVYSYGLVLWEIAAPGRLPPMKFNVIKASAPEGTPREFWVTIVNCSHPEPERRRTIRQTVRRIESILSSDLEPPGAAPVAGAKPPAAGPAGQSASKAHTNRDLAATDTPTTAADDDDDANFDDWDLVLTDDINPEEVARDSTARRPSAVLDAIGRLGAMFVRK
jgi:serine/threonine protein kinase